MEIISVHNLGLEAQNQKILQNINFSINKGQHTSINGPSGSGKSTILRILSKLTKESEGYCEFEGNKINDFEYTDYRKQVSYVIQNPQLIGETVEDNLAFPAQIRSEEFDSKIADYLKEKLGLSYIENSKKITELSGGEKQRIGLTRNLMYPPKVLLLDEVTSSLDEETTKLVWKLLFEEAENNDITLIWVSHDEDEQNMAKNKIYLKNGRQIEEGINE